tara:strand:+ start:361 stop:468 length:108 start_codon:yes stop_codon:yes gene_type:complete
MIEPLTLPVLPMRVSNPFQCVVALGLGFDMGWQPA